MLLERAGWLFTKGSNLFILLPGVWEEQVGQDNPLLLSTGQNTRMLNVRS